MISSHMLHGVAVCAFHDFRIHSVLRKITEKKLRTYQVGNRRDALFRKNISAICYSSEKC